MGRDWLKAVWQDIQRHSRTKKGPGLIGELFPSSVRAQSDSVGSKHPFSPL